jgi:serine/threonine protein kinase
MNELSEKFLRTDYDEIYSLSNNSDVVVVRSRRTGEIFVRKYVDNKYSEIYKQLSTLDIPNIPKVISITDNGEQAIIIEEFISGITLKKKIELNGVITEKTARKYAVDICDALIGLHKAGIVHRDISPSNIMIRSDDCAYLIDFDISRTKKVNKNADTEILGTAGYAAPEQFGFKQTDERSDIYSLGVILRFMLTGSESESVIGGKIGKIIEKCTQIEPKNRYESVLKLKEALSKNKKKKKIWIAAALILCAFVFAVGGYSLGVRKNVDNSVYSNMEILLETDKPLNEIETIEPTLSTEAVSGNGYMTMEIYKKIKNGMTYDEVVALVGSKGECIWSNEYEDFISEIYLWQGDPTDEASNANISFDNGKVTGKLQNFLK